MNRIPRLLLCCFGLLAALAPRPDFEAQRERAAVALVVELLEIADWCQETKLYQGRFECLHEVLRLNPQNQDAHEGLGHKRQRDGSWKKPKRGKPPRNHAPEELGAYRSRRLRAAKAYTTAVLDALDQAEEKPTDERLETLREELLRLAPDDTRVRAAFGEARGNEGWILAESVGGPQRRAELKEILRAAYQTAVPAVEVEPNEQERAIGMQWTRVLETPAGRVLGTADVGELETVARALQAARAYFNGIFGTDVDYYPGGSVYVLAKKGDKEKFISGHPVVDEEYEKFLLTLECSGIQGSHDMAHWGSDPKQRLDGIVRIAIGWLMYQAFGITSNVAWVYEGFGLYITREVVGTRLTWFVQTSEYLDEREEDALRALLMDEKTNWMSEANKVLQREHSPNLTFVMGKTVNNMTPEEMLFSYVVAAYALEGRGALVGELLKKIGEPTASQQAVAAVYGIDVRKLDQRVRRWLTERK